MIDKDIYKMIEILMEISKERYFEFKKEVLDDNEISDELIRFFYIAFRFDRKAQARTSERWCGVVNNGEVFAKLVHLATTHGIIVRFAPLQYHDGRLKGNRLAVRQDLPTIEEFNYNLAHELAHAFLHYDKGDTINSDCHMEYEEQADRAAKMLLAALST